MTSRYQRPLNGNLMTLRACRTCVTEQSLGTSPTARVLFRQWISRLVMTCLVGVIAVTAQAADETPKFTESQLQFFETKIRPVLVTHCYECHAAGAKTLQGGLRLDSRAGLLKGGDNGPAIALKAPQSSLLLKALRHDGIEMPPKGRLSASVVKDFEAWLEMGAPDPRQTSESRVAKSIDIEAGRQHWAFQPVRDPALPIVKDTDWSRGEIDRFVLAKLEEKGIKPLADADRALWLRRVSLDLIGLLPTPTEIEDFLNDQTPQARENVVDRLLASRGFGERWARHWLDLTGYADQVGTSNEIFAEHAWRYRDYLIEAFNNDKPFDRFVREQIAGDLLPSNSPEERASHLVATGFLLVGDVEVVNPDKLKMETDHLDSQLSKIGTVFMGMTIGCARCHDHKFDPIEAVDYYAMAGTLRNTVSTRKIDNGIWSGLNVVELPESEAQLAVRQARATEHQQKIDKLKSERQQLTDEQTQLKDDQKQRRDEISNRLRQIGSELQHAEFFAPSIPKAFAVQEAATFSDMPIMIRGNPYTPGAIVPRGVMRVANWGPAPSMPQEHSGRLQLADWLADARHPLTARVTVNRLWQKLFGEGLVRSVDYFGVRGEQPSHPELLDHLATRFIRNGWSQKKLLRDLVLSRVYGLNSGHNSDNAAVDPENRMLWRMNSQRLDAEALRDAMLVASGEMVASAGGPSLPLEYLENTGNLAAKSVNPPSFTLRKFRPEQEFVRTIYLPIVRSAQSGPAKLRNVFDFTQPAQIAGRRSQTVVAPQALYLLNDDLPRQRAKALATAITTTSNNRDGQVASLWLRTLNRPITAIERDEAFAFLDSLSGQSDGLIELCHAVLGSNEFIHRR